MVSEIEMRSTLTAAGARCRNTADREYWYHRKWNNGLPLGLAYVEIEKELKRIREREAQIATIKRLGFRFRNDLRIPNAPTFGWVHEKMGDRVFTRRTAFEMAETWFPELHSDIANGRD